MINTKEISNKILNENFINFLKSKFHKNYIGNEEFKKLHLFHLYKNENECTNSSIGTWYLYLGSNKESALFLFINCEFLDAFEIKDIKFNKFFGNKNNFKYNNEHYTDKGYDRKVLQYIMDGIL